MFISQFYDSREVTSNRPVLVDITPYLVTSIDDSGDTYVADLGSTMGVYTKGADGIWTSQHTFVDDPVITASISGDGDTVVLLQTGNLKVYTRTGSVWSLDATVNDTPVLTRLRKVYVNTDGTVISAFDTQADTIHVWRKSGTWPTTATTLAGYWYDNFAMSGDGDSIVTQNTSVTYQQDWNGSSWVQTDLSSFYINNNKSDNLLMQMDLTGGAIAYILNSSVDAEIRIVGVGETQLNYLPVHGISELTNDGTTIIADGEYIFDRVGSVWTRRDASLYVDNLPSTFTFAKVSATNGEVIAASSKLYHHTSFY